MSLCRLPEHVAAVRQVIHLQFDHLSAETLGLLLELSGTAGLAAIRAHDLPGG